jgi:hypothetical protein
LIEGVDHVLKTFAWLCHFTSVLSV